MNGLAGSQTHILHVAKNPERPPDYSAHIHEWVCHKRFNIKAL